MLISTEQKAVIRAIAQEQLKSFLKIVNQKMYEDLIAEMEEEGYDVSEIDTLEYFADEMEKWEAVLQDPTQMDKLDELNLGVLRHILINKFEMDPHTRGIWKKLNLMEKVNKTPN